MSERDFWSRSIWHRSGAGFGPVARGSKGWRRDKLAAVASAARIAWLRTASPNASRMRSAKPDCAMRSSKFKAKARQAHLAPLAPPSLLSDPPALHPTTNDRPARPVVFNKHCRSCSSSGVSFSRDVQRAWRRRQRSFSSQGLSSGTHDEPSRPHSRSQRRGKADGVKTQKSYQYSIVTWY